MPKVPEYNIPPLKPYYKVNDPHELASIKQKNYITTLCERRGIPVPYMKHLKKGEAAQLISNMVNSFSSQEKLQ